MAEYAFTLSADQEERLAWYVAHKKLEETPEDWLKAQVETLLEDLRTERRNYDTQQMLAAFNALPEAQQAAVQAVIAGLLTPEGQAVALAYTALSPEDREAFVVNVYRWLGLTAAA